MRSGIPFQFSTKAATLAFLAENLSSAVVCERIVFRRVPGVLTKGG